MLKYEDEDSAFGDVARDMMVQVKQKELKKTWGYRRVVNHLSMMPSAVSEKVFHILEEANERYKMLPKKS